ncbi:indolepyruvate oxidoreductase subunit beta family protein [Pseudodonghicola flavimaris]|uniref:Indolepyruvate oxidoreductase subunit beta family protein n=1 Tax=Pseudodonghicola flavimaris TaxID=3050036 RepID=A0ABT7EYD2_9RHOB|nr:indolepyruvate oxidoreductase subunit beta family protein [Pseudodonghicola flavimaris]MDK3017279.1 indolepyruvate oxidoreductase subunit beta family protein [Pseudodonghicola flavimaris]
MTIQQALAPRQPDEKLTTIIKLAIMAVGGQGGGVLTNWIEATARSQGYACQATSVAGVAQRTGATIYYVEMAPMGDGVAPVFSLAPSAGDVDVLIAAEMMEAGRAILRGFVTPDRTTLIASTHRALAVSEKMVPGDGIASSDEVRAAAEVAADKLIMFDMDSLAIQNGSVISSSLFGALAGSGALPFPREAFEAAIRASGKGVEASLRAFSAAYDRAQNAAVDPAQADQAKPAAAALAPEGPAALMRDWQALTDRVLALPAPAQEMALHGLRKVVKFQDVAYGAEYMDRLEEIAALDDAAHGFVLTAEAAKYIANAMAYDDVIRVADLKTRGARFDRIKAHMGSGDRPVALTEFMHPRAEEIAGMMPAAMGARWEANPKAMARLDRWFNKGRRLRTHKLGNFLMLYVLGGLRGYRRRTLRHKYEQEHLARWLDTVKGAVAGHYAFAVELIRCRRLIKGYSDTHARGLSKFDKVMQAAELVRAREDGADWVARLREAALQDEKGAALDGAILTVRSFAG